MQELDIYQGKNSMKTDPKVFIVGDWASSFLFEDLGHLVARDTDPFGGDEKCYLMVCGKMDIPGYLGDATGMERCAYCEKGEINNNMMSPALAKILGVPYTS